MDHNDDVFLDTGIRKCGKTVINGFLSGISSRNDPLELIYIELLGICPHYLAP